MGMSASSLQQPPKVGFKWYMYLIGGSEEVRKLAATQVSELGLILGPKALLIAGTEDLEKEIADVLCGGELFNDSAFAKLFASTPRMIVSEGNILTTRSPVYLLPLPPHSDIQRAEQKVLRKPLRFLANSIRSDALEKRMKELRSQHLSLAPLPAGVLVSTPEKINTLRKLEPSIWSIGINLNKLITSWLASTART